MMISTPAPTSGHWPPLSKAEYNNTLYKTELCKSFSETGYCRYGLKCRFAHGGDDLRQVQRHKKYKTERCKNFGGACPYGNRCRFIHADDPPEIFMANGSPNLTPSPPSASSLTSVLSSGVLSSSGSRPGSRRGVSTPNFDDDRIQLQRVYSDRQLSGEYDHEADDDLSPTGTRNRRTRSWQSQHSRYPSGEGSFHDTSFSHSSGMAGSPSTASVHMERHSTESPVPSPLSQSSTGYSFFPRSASGSSPHSSSHSGERFGTSRSQPTSQPGSPRTLHRNRMAFPAQGPTILIPTDKMPFLPPPPAALPMGTSATPLGPEPPPRTHRRSMSGFTERPQVPQYDGARLGVAAAAGSSRSVDQGFAATTPTSAGFSRGFHRRTGSAGGLSSLPRRSPSPRQFPMSSRSPVEYPYTPSADQPGWIGSRFRESPLEHGDAPVSASAAEYYQALEEARIREQILSRQYVSSRGVSPQATSHRTSSVHSIALQQRERDEFVAAAHRGGLTALPAPALAPVPSRPRALSDTERSDTSPSIARRSSFGEDPVRPRVLQHMSSLGEIVEIEDERRREEFHQAQQRARQGEEDEEEKAPLWADSADMTGLPAFFSSHSQAPDHHAMLEEERLRFQAMRLQESATVAPRPASREGQAFIRPASREAIARPSSRDGRSSPSDMTVSTPPVVSSSSRVAPRPALGLGLQVERPEPKRVSVFDIPSPLSRDLVQDGAAGFERR